MAKEQGSQTDKRQYVLIAYLALGVAMILMTLVLAFTAETPAMTQVTAVTRTQSPLVLTRQADYVTVEPAAHQGGGLGGGRGQHAEATPVSTIESGTAAPTGANDDTSH